MTDFEHPLFASAEWHGCTTESLRWTDADYCETAGKVGVLPTSQADSSVHLFFIDLAVRTNDGREIVLERIEGGKLLEVLKEVEKKVARRHFDHEKAALTAAVNDLAAGRITSPVSVLQVAQRYSAAVSTKLRVNG